MRYRRLGWICLIWFVCSASFFFRHKNRYKSMHNLTQILSKIAKKRNMVCNFTSLIEIVNDGILRYWYQFYSKHITYQILILFCFISNTLHLKFQFCSKYKRTCIAILEYHITCKNHQIIFSHNYNTVLTTIVL